MLFRAVFTTILSAVPVLAQAVEISRWSPPPNEERLRPRMHCSALRALTGYEFSVISATLQPASDSAPEFCRVTGQIQPEIQFEVALPALWHKRLLMIGNGGYAGENLESPGRMATRDQAVKSGFVFTQTNTGHDAAQEPLGAFAVNRQKLLDYAFRAVHVTAETAKRIAAAYYGTAPARSYFMGCSTGGRQALISAQRFPQDFDGIIAGAPVLDFVGTMMNYVSIQQAMAAAPVPPAKLKLAGEIAYRLCDADDGVKDGVIDDPRRCGFKPSTHLPVCRGNDAPDCFTPGQIRTLETISSDQRIQGKRVFPGWPVGAEAVGANGDIGWQGWLFREDGRPPNFVVFSETFFRYLAEPKKNPDLQLSRLDFERNPPKLDWIRQVLNATDTDLSAFRDRGGKLIMWFGWADPALNPMMGVEYYESVLRTMGPGTRDFFRLYMMPGVFHCSGGIGCDAALRLAALIQWVEEGKAPDRIVAMKIAGGKVVRTRPLCPYPEVARYKGAGSIDDAKSFVCSAPK